MLLAELSPTSFSWFKEKLMISFGGFFFVQYAKKWM